MSAEPIIEEVNPYLSGVFAPVYDEVTRSDLEVIGTVPTDLVGLYVRNGPNPQFPPQGRYHWFDGDGMVHAVRFLDGEVTYRNRHIPTEGFLAEAEHGGPLFTGTVERFTDNPRQTLKNLPLKDTSSTDVVYFNGRLITLWYLGGRPYAFDPETMESVGIEDMHGTLQLDLSAHSKVDERTGELLFFDYGPERPYMRFGSAGPNGRVEHLVEIDLPGPRLPHDMGFTENYAVLMDLPLINNPDAYAAGRWKLDFRRDLPARFGVLPRRGQSSDIRWFEANPCYIYHVVRSFETGNRIVMEVCRVTRPEYKYTSNPNAGTKLSPVGRLMTYLQLHAHMYRYVFDLETGSTTEEQMDDEDTEFPVVPTHLVGRDARYSYNVHIADNDLQLFDGIIKYDLHRGTSEKTLMDGRKWLSEVGFCPRVGATDEDDGYVISFVHDEDADQSSVWVWHAQDIPGGPLCQIKLPVRVPLGFHSTFVREDQLAMPRV